MSIYTKPVHIPKNEGYLNGRLLDIDHTRDKVVLLIPGYGATMNNFSSTYMEKHLGNRGISTLSVTLSGHDNPRFIDAKLSEMERDISATLDFLSTEGYKSIGVFGNSLSSLPAIKAVSNSSGSKVYAMALKSPVINMKDSLERVFDKKTIDAAKRIGSMIFFREEDGFFRTPISVYDDAQNYALGSETLTMPTLISYGTLDGLVTPEDIDILRKIFPNSKVNTYPAAHNLAIQEDYEIAMRPFVDWLTYAR